MIVVCESTVAYKSTKPVICPKCEQGQLGRISAISKAVMSRRGKPPQEERNECVEVKCPICGKLWSLTIEN